MNPLDASKDPDSIECRGVLTRRTNIRIVAAVIAAVAIAGAAHADPVRFHWTGTVSFADPTLASAGIVVGTPAVGHYRFESTTPDGDPDPQIGLYDLALLEWRVAVGLIDNTTTLPGFGSITVWLDFEAQGDVYEVRVGPAIFLRLQDLDGTAFASDALPTTPPELAAFEAAGLAQLDPNTLQPLVVIDLDTLTLAPSPIPALPSWGAAAIAFLTLLTSRSALAAGRTSGRGRSRRHGSCRGGAPPRPGCRPLPR